MIIARLKASGYCAPTMQQEVQIIKETDTEVEYVSREDKTPRVLKKVNPLSGYKIELTCEDGRKIIE